MSRRFSQQSVGGAGDFAAVEVAVADYAFAVENIYSGPTVDVPGDGDRALFLGTFGQRKAKIARRLRLETTRSCKISSSTVLWKAGLC